MWFIWEKKYLKDVICEKRSLGALVLKDNVWNSWTHNVSYAYLLSVVHIR